MPVMWGPTAWDSADVEQSDRVRKAQDGAVPGAILLGHDGFAGPLDGVDDGPAPVIDRGELADRVLDAYRRPRAARLLARPGARRRKCRARSTIPPLSPRAGSAVQEPAGEVAHTEQVVADKWRQHSGKCVRSNARERGHHEDGRVGQRRQRGAYAERGQSGRALPSRSPGRHRDTGRAPARWYAGRATTATAATRARALLRSRPPRRRCPTRCPSRYTRREARTSRRCSGTGQRSGRGRGRPNSQHRKASGSSRRSPVARIRA